jgi:hypothetical protein
MSAADGNEVPLSRASRLHNHLKGDFAALPVRNFDTSSTTVSENTCPDPTFADTNEPVLANKASEHTSQQPQTTAQALDQKSLFYTLIL